MAKTVEDFAGIIKIIVSTTDSPLQLPAQLPMTWSNFSLGFVDPKLWQLPSFLLAPDKEYSKQMMSSYEAAIDKIKTPHSVPSPTCPPFRATVWRQFRISDNTVYIRALLVFPMMKEELIKSTVGEIRDSVNRTLKALPSTPVRSLAEVIKFNEDNPDLQAGRTKPITSKRKRMTSIRKGSSRPGKK
ncbi:MAG: hypothetical protein Q9204_004462 [Flavoplaca sp. TL-2023a]